MRPEAPAAVRVPGARTDEDGGLVALPPVRALLAALAALALTRWRAVSVGIFLASVGVFALIAATVSDLDWDLLAYTAVVLEDTARTPEALHEATYAALRTSASDEQWWQLVTAYPFRADMARNAEDFVSMLGMYRVKVGYVFMLEQFGAQTDPVQAARSVNALAVALIGAAVLGYFLAAGAAGALAPMAFVLLACNYLGMAIAPQPDAMAGGLALAAILLVASQRPLLALPFLFAALLVRTDNIIVIFGLMCAALAYGTMRWAMAAAFAVALAFVAFGLEDAGHPGWWPHVYFSVIGIQDSMTDFSPGFDLALYLETLAAHAAMVFRNNTWGALLVLTLFGWALLAVRRIPVGVGGRVAILACVLAAFGKFVVFPLSLDRIYFAQAIGAAAVVLAASRVTLAPPSRG